MAEASSPLPTSRGFVTALINTLSKFEAHDVRNERDRMETWNLAANTSEDRTDLSSSVKAPAGSSVATARRTNPLTDAPRPVKEVLLTLHVLYPHSLLPALDLLDRGLITRLSIASADAATSSPKPADIPPHPRPDSEPADKPAAAYTAGHALEHGHTATRSPPPSASSGHAIDAVYHVRSARAPAGFHRRRAGSGKDGGTGDGIASASAGATTSYEVRTGVWNCSCPAFAFAAFPAGVESDVGEESSEEGEEGYKAEESRDWVFGGLSRGGEAEAPVCKHLLACILAERCGLFTEHVQEKRLTEAEADGWAAGWGD
jgi:hypothetical protein